MTITARTRPISSSNHNKSRSLKTRPSTLHKRSTKNINLKSYIRALTSKPSSNLTPDEHQIIVNYEIRRHRKNERSRQRTKENKVEMMRIMALPEHDRSQGERDWLVKHLQAKKRKNWKDRERRKKMKSKEAMVRSGTMDGSQAHLAITASSSSHLLTILMNSSSHHQQNHDLLRSDTHTSVESNLDYDYDCNQYFYCCEWNVNVE